ncbi:hypothetical protein [Rhizobium sp. M1]|uniref:hypothetical protein n=1 Tax=Rhizobium sp. M1 TaxID=2035453 RepID=UPI000BE9244D|nr:hypothetical protein [Rhizobium sp. M1]PDT10018.1 hypothetical protein CO655_15615 [Rhizobium sp. M1]
MFSTIEGKLVEDRDNSNDLAAVQRMVSLIGTRMSLPIQPFADEGLADVIFRAACENGYVRVSLIAQVLGMAVNKRMTHESLARANLDPLAIANLLGTRTEDDARGLIYPWLDEALTRIVFFGRNVRAKGFFVTGRRVAPVALEQRCYQRAAWSVAGLGFDPETRQRLLSKCPECGNRLGYNIAYKIWACSPCFSEGNVVDFRKSQLGTVKVDDEQALEFAVNLIDPRVPVDRVDLHHLPSELRKFDPGELFQLIVGLAEKLEAKESPSDTADAPSPSYLAAASRALMNWPQGLDQLSERLMIDEKGSLGRAHCGHNPLRSATSAVSPELAQLVIPSYYRARDSRLSSDIATLRVNDRTSAEMRVGIADLEATGEWRAKRGNVTASSLRLMVDHCLATNQGISETQASYMQLAASPQFRAMSNLYGIPIPFLPDVVDFDTGQERLVFGSTAHVGSIGTLGEVLRQVAQSGAPPRGCLPLADAVSSLCIARVNPWPAVFAGLASGAVEFYFGSRESLPLSKRIVVREFRSLSAVLRGIRDDPHLGTRKADIRTVASILGLSVAIAKRWQARGLLPTDPTMDMVWAQKERFIAVTEVQHLLQIAGDRNSNIRAVLKELRDAGVSEHGRKVRNSLIKLYDRDQVQSYFGARFAPTISD